MNYRTLQANKVRAFRGRINFHLNIAVCAICLKFVKDGTKMTNKEYCFRDSNRHVRVCTEYILIRFIIKIS